MLGATSPRRSAIYLRDLRGGPVKYPLRRALSYGEYPCGMVEKERRKIRSDATVGTVEKKLGLPPGTFRNPDGRDTRSDKKIKRVRDE